MPATESRAGHWYDRYVAAILAIGKIDAELSKIQGRNIIAAAELKRKHETSTLMWFALQTERELEAKRKK